MNILLTGVTGYIGGRLLPVLLEEGHTVYACVRDKNRFPQGYSDYQNLHILEVDFLSPDNKKAPSDIDAAYYLIHSMTSSSGHFSESESNQATNFIKYVSESNISQVIYLSGIAQGEELSEHLYSRKQVGKILSKGNFHLTILQAAIIIGAGSASFEIMYDLVDKLPILLVPATLNNMCQPIAAKNVIYYLKKALLNKLLYDQNFDIGGPDIISYKDMLEIISECRSLKRIIITIPAIPTRFIAHWFYFVTSTSYKLAFNLSDSMKNKVICRENRIKELIPQRLLNYNEMVKLALEKLESNNILTSWKDSFVSSGIDYKISERWNVPTHGVSTYEVERKITVSREEIIKRIWETGGSTGWWFGQWLWDSRAFLDLLGKGVGMRGRTNKNKLTAGDALDFWRVLIADDKEGRLLLYAEMIMPGEGWLDFKLTEHNNKLYLSIKATFRPHGLKGHIYWNMTKPFHHYIFNGMMKKLNSTDINK